MTLRTTKPFRRGNDAPDQPQLPRVGRINISQTRGRVLGIFATVGIAGTCFGLMLILWLAAYAAPPAQSPMPFVYAATFCFSACVILLLIASGIAGRLLKYTYDSELIIATQDIGLTDYREDNAWLVACLNGRTTAAGGSGDRATSPAANVFPINTRKH